MEPNIESASEKIINEMITAGYAPESEDEKKQFTDYLREIHAKHLGGIKLTIVASATVAAVATATGTTTGGGKVSGYNLFTKSIMKEIKGLTFTDVAAKWKAMTDEEKKPYNDEAKQRKLVSTGIVAGTATAPVTGAAAVAVGKESNSWQRYQKAWYAVQTKQKKEGEKLKVNEGGKACGEAYKACGFKTMTRENQEAFIVAMMA
jgi:hypothetical protein